MAKATLSAPTAADVRALFREDEKRMAALPEAAQATVKAGARGRLHPDAIKAFNKGRKAHRRYVLGASSAAKAQVKAQREALVKAGVPVGKRGPLNAAAKEALASVKV
jgi:hypothetical protein